MKSADKATATQLIQHTLELSKLDTIRGIYNRIRGGTDGRIRTKLAPYTETGRLASGEDPWWPEPTCLTGDAEVLTPEGWRRFDELEDSTVQTVQWHPNGELSWCNAPITRAAYSGLLVVADSWFHKLQYTANHRVPYYHSSREDLRETNAETMLTWTGAWRQPAAGRMRYTESVVPEYLARFIAALQADGSWREYDAVTFAFKKKRKIVRLRNLLDSCGIPDVYSEHTAGGYTKFYVSNRLGRQALAWLGKDKKLGPWLLEWDTAALEAFLNEASYWDATHRNDSFMYFSVHKENVEWLATVAHLTGWSASIRCCLNRNKGSYGEHSARPLFTANIKPRTYICGAPAHMSTRHFEGTVYCVTTDTSYFLVRREDRILVTGNTNLQNLPKKAAKLDPLFEIRNSIVPSPGCVFIEGDLKQAEAICTAAYANDWPKVDRLMHADEHSLLAARIFSIPVEQVNKETHRQLGKMANHGLNYGAGWKTFMEAINKDYDITGLAIDARMAKKVLAAWQAMNPKTVRWWREAKESAQRDGYLTNCFGRKRIFLNLNTAGNDVIAFLPQSTIADLLNTALVRLYAKEHLGFRIVLQIHDAILVEAPMARWAAVAKVMKETMLVPMTINNRELTVPVDISMSSKCWGKMKEVEV